LNDELIKANTELTQVNIEKGKAETELTKANTELTKANTEVDIEKGKSIKLKNTFQIEEASYVRYRNCVKDRGYFGSEEFCGALKEEYEIDQKRARQLRNLEIERSRARQVRNLGIERSNKPYLNSGFNHSIQSKSSLKDHPRIEN
jgi:uncharacterized protein (DUF3084 family)